MSWWDSYPVPIAEEEPLILEGRMCDGCLRPSCPNACPYQPTEAVNG